MTRLRKADAERRAENDYGGDFSEALARGITIMTAFNSERRQMTLSDVARAVDLPRATARRALYTLARLGYVETEGRLYRLMPKVLRLASAYLTSNPASTILQPACERMAVQAKTTCSIAVLDAGEVVLVARAVPSQPTTIGLGVGYRLPAYCSSLGRVLLSALSEKDLDGYLQNLKATRITPRTIVDKAKLRKIIANVRAEEFALVDEEAEAGLRSLSVPIRRYDKTPIAAMNVVAPIDRFTDKQMLKSYLPMLREEAASIQAQLL